MRRTMSLAPVSSLPRFLSGRGPAQTCQAPLIFFRVTVPESMANLDSGCGSGASTREDMVVPSGDLGRVVLAADGCEVAGGNAALGGRIGSRIGSGNRRICIDG